MLEILDGYHYLSSAKYLTIGIRYIYFLFYQSKDLNKKYKF